MKLSIITINYNNRDGLRKTIESVVNQTWQEFEYIIIDGGSTDGSVEVIKEYADRIDYWVSEPDKGIYDAMNKGIDQAKGEYCLFMNSADTIYEKTTLEKVNAELDGTDIISGKTITDTRTVLTPPPIINFSFLYQSMINHQSMFICSAIMKKHKYDTSYKIVSDWKFLIECLVLNNGTYKALEPIIALYDTSGLSSLNKDLLQQEKCQILSAIIPNRILTEYNQYYHQASFEERLYRIITKNRLHKIFYSINILPFKILSFFSNTSKWAKKFPIKI